MTDPEALLELHVAFELARWSGARLEESVEEHVATVLEAWDHTRVGDLAPADRVAGAVGRLVEDLALTDELLALVADVAASGHAALLERHTPVGDLVGPEDYDALVALVTGQEAVRREVIEALTASKAYSRLVSHVLYQGLKGYLLTENVLARKVPGASSLVRLGQRGLSSAAPKLEAGVDRRLTSFVEANLVDTLRESRRYLEATLDGEMLGEMAEEAWGALAERPLSSVVDLVDPTDTRAMVVAFAPVLRRWRDAGLLAEVAGAVVATELERHADRTVGELLADCGIETGPLVRDVVALLRPTIEHAHATGLLERLVRAELAPFYEALPGLADAVRGPAARSPRSRRPR